MILQIEQCRVGEGVAEWVRGRVERVARGLDGGGSGTRAVRRRCIVLAKISIRGGGDGSEAGTFFSALTFQDFQRPEKEGEKEDEKKERRHNTPSRSEWMRIGTGTGGGGGKFVGKLSRERVKGMQSCYI